MEKESLKCGAESERLARLVLHGVLLNGAGAGGLLGNALAVLVLSRPQMRSSINCLLIGLAACDAALIITSVLLFGLTAVYPYTGHLRYYYFHIYPHLTPYAYPLANTAQTMSVYLTLMVTVERWVAVCYPFRALSLCTWSRARWCVLGTTLFSVLYNIPKFFEVKAYRIVSADGSDTVYCVGTTNFRSDTYLLVYTHWLYLLVMYVVPLGALAVLNVSIARGVRAAHAARGQLTSARRHELGLATMLLVIVLVFFLCNILSLVTNACEVFMPDEFASLDLLVMTSNLLVVINSSVNFVIYVVLGEKFKRVFVQMFCGWVKRSRGRTPPASTSSAPSPCDRASPPPPPLSSHSTCTDLELYS